MIAVLATACGPGGSTASPAASSTAAASQPASDAPSAPPASASAPAVVDCDTGGKKIAFVVPLRIPIVDQILVGAKDAATECNAELSDVGPQAFDPAAAVQAFQDAVTAGADALVFDALPNDVYAQPVTNTTIPMAQYIASVTTPDPPVLVGINQFDVGYSIADLIIGELPADAVRHDRRRQLRTGPQGARPADPGDQGPLRREAAFGHRRGAARDEPGPDDEPDRVAEHHPGQRQFARVRRRLRPGPAEPDPDPAAGDRRDLPPRRGRGPAGDPRRDQGRHRRRCCRPEPLPRGLHPGATARARAGRGRRPADRLDQPGPRHRDRRQRRRRDRPRGVARGGDRVLRADRRGVLRLRHQRQGAADQRTSTRRRSSNR